MKSKLNTGLFLMILIIVGIIFIRYILKENTQETRALFSWKDSEVLESKELFDDMKKLKLNTVYQDFSGDLRKKDILKFLEKAKEREINVYFLAGDPRWAIEKNAESMRDIVDRVIEINKDVSQKQQIKGVFFDVEPYLLDEWNNKSRKSIMENLLKNMEVIYKEAHENNLEVIMCIPYFYDNFGLLDYVETLIKSNCDKVAIMNYYRGKEYENIKAEAILAGKYNKEIINIYELQAPGKHDLTDKNTYHEEGIDEVEKNFQQLKEKLSNQRVSIAFHECKALKEVMEDE